MTMLAPCKSPLRPPDDSVFNPEQWTTLMSLLDTIVPSITTIESEQKSRLRVESAAYARSVTSMQHLLPTSTDPSVVAAYLAESAISHPDFPRCIQHILSRNVPKDQIKALCLILSMLNTRAGCFVLTRSTVLFHLQPPAAREQILLAWSRSYFSALGGLYRTMAMLAKRVWVWTSPTLPKMIGFPAVPKHGDRATGYPYQFLDLGSPGLPPTIETDVLIVGSGCGAGVCAKNLAEAGYKVLVAEKSHYFASTHFPMSESDGAFHLMENAGVVTSDDASMAVVAGSTFGGGGTVNWSASLQTQEYVRQEWFDQGLPFFTSVEFQKCLDRVCAYIGASTSGIKHNFANRTLLEGSRRLGYSAKDVPQNTGGKDHYCGYCTYGCASGAKNGPAACFFPAAAKAGAQFIQGFDVREIEFERVDGVKRVAGAKGIWTDKETEKTREIRVRARRVVVSAGTLNSPLLLMRSGIKNRHLGKNLHLHPATFVGARMDEATNPWEGGILTSVNTSFENLDRKGHGCKIECTTMMPSYFLPSVSLATPGTTTPALDFKTRASAFHHHIGFVIIARDRDTGYVYSDRTDGRVRISYTPSAFDTSSLVEGSIAAAKIAYVNGAREVFTTNDQLPPFVRPNPATADITTTSSSDSQNEKENREAQPYGDEDGNENENEDIDQGINSPSFQSWLRKLRRTGLSSPDPNILVSAHQMGSCRMGKSPKKGVVDPKGRVWGFETTGGLYVADASVFPSASGVNPMVTTLAIADWISRNVIRDANTRKGEGEGEGEWKGKAEREKKARKRRFKKCFI